MIRIYISGPISNMPMLNRPAFDKATDLLRENGYEAVNPFEVCPAPTTWEDAMRDDLAALVRCEVIAMLPGWRNSRGAQLEHKVATELGMHVVFFSSLECAR